MAAKPNLEKNVKIISWNAQSASNKADELEHKLKTENIQIICIQEVHGGTCKSTNNPINIKGYSANYLPPNLSPNARQHGLLTLIRDDLPFETFDIKGYPIDIQIQGTTIFTNKGPLNIFNIYQTPRPKYLIDFNKITNFSATEPFLIVGDFNAHSHRWTNPNNKSPQNKAGESINDYLDTNDNIILLNDGSETHNRGGCLDLCFASEDIAHNLTCSAENFATSDHRMMKIISNGLLPPPNTIQHIPKWNIKKAKWEDFTTILDLELNKHPPNDDINDEEQRISTAFNNAAKQTIPLTRPSKKITEAWWQNEELAAQKRNINKLLRIYKNQINTVNKNNLRKAEYTFRQACKDAKLAAKQAWCDSLGRESSLDMLWKTAQKMSGKFPKTKISPEPEKQANIIMENFAKRTKTKNLSDQTIKIFNEDLKNKKRNIKTAEECVDELDEDFDISEIKTVISKLKISAPGGDNIHNTFLTHASDNALKQITNLYNMSWRAGKLPTSWKSAIIVPIPKKEEGSFRPISLLSCLSKVMERAILNRINNKIGEPPPNIYAYTKGRGTLEALTHTIGILSNSKSKNFTAVAVFLDLEKAFELANPISILNALVTKGLKGKLLTWTTDYLTDRKAKTRYQGKLSNIFTFENGTPQGSILSPYLFNCLMEITFTTPKNSKSEIILYADDVCIINTIKPLNINTTLKHIVANCHLQGLKISDTKTKVMSFGKRPGRHDFSLNKKLLQKEKSLKYLGLTIDNKLTFVEHANDLKKRIEKKLNLMRFITSSTYGAPLNMLRTFYKTTMLPILQYGRLAATISHDSNNILNITNNKALRTILGIPVWYKTDLLYEELGLPNLEQTAEKDTLRFLKKQKLDTIINLINNTKANPGSLGAQFESIMQKYKVRKAQITSNDLDRPTLESLELKEINKMSRDQIDKEIIEKSKENQTIKRHLKINRKCRRKLKTVTQRKHSVLSTKLRLGYKRFEDYKEIASPCTLCNKPYHVDHYLADCIAFSFARDQYLKHINLTKYCKNFKIKLLGRMQEPKYKKYTESFLDTLYQKLHPLDLPKK